MVATKHPIFDYFMREENTMATAKNAPAKKAPAKKATAKKAAPKATAKKSNDFNLKASAEKAINIYLGVLGTSFDRVQENLKSARKDNEKRMSGYEKRGAKLRKELENRFDKLEAPEFDNVVEDIKSQINKLQDQVEDVVETAKEKLTPAKKAA